MKPIVNIDDLECYEFGNGAEFSAQLSRVGALIGAKKLGALFHRVPPGKCAFPKHAHHANEEMMIVLAGSGTYHCGTQRWPIKSGDIIAAPAGDGLTAHQIENTSNDDLSYLCVSTKNDPGRR